MYLYLTTHPLKTGNLELEEDMVISATYKIEDRIPFTGNVKLLGTLLFPRIFMTQKKGKTPEEVLAAINSAQIIAKRFNKDAEQLKGGAGECYT